MNNKIILLSSCLAFGFCSAYLVAKRYIFYQFPILATQKIGQEKHLVVITTTYNNKHYCERNLLSLFTQKHGNEPYKNWSLMLVDDNSPDGQFEIIENFVKAHHMESHCKLTKNNERKGAAANVYEIMKSITDDKAVVLWVDGDDWLAHDRVFERINEIYQDPNVWTTYGQYVYWPEYTNAPNHQLPRLVNYKRIRDYDYFASHLRTFYAGLGKKIKLESLRYEGGWLPDVDVAVMWPIMEMAGIEHIRWIPEILYVYNRAPGDVRTDPVHYGKLTQQRRNEIIALMRTWPAYPQLANLDSTLT